MSWRSACVAGLGLLLAGCQNPYEVAVTYKYLKPPGPLPQGTVFVEQGQTVDASFADYAAEAYRWLGSLGYAQAASAESADYVVKLGYAWNTKYARVTETVSEPCIDQDPVCPPSHTIDVDQQVVETVLLPVLNVDIVPAAKTGETPGSSVATIDVQDRPMPGQTAVREMHAALAAAFLAFPGIDGQVEGVRLDVANDSVCAHIYVGLAEVSNKCMPRSAVPGL